MFVSIVSLILNGVAFLAFAGCLIAGGSRYGEFLSMEWRTWWLFGFVAIGIAFMLRVFYT